VTSALATSLRIVSSRSSIIGLVMIAIVHS
jgi:hypothetical protein